MRTLKLFKAIKHFAVVFYDTLVETRKLQAKSKLAQRSWY